MRYHIKLRDLQLSWPQSLMCAGACFYFRPSKLYSGPLCTVLWPAGLCCVYVRSVAVTLSSAGSWDSTKLDKIGGNWHKLGLMRLGAAAVPYLGWAGAAGCSARSAPASRTSWRHRRGEAAPGWLLRVLLVSCHCRTTGHSAMDKLTEPTAAGNRVTRPQPRPAVPPPPANQRPGRGRAAAG